MLTWRNSLLALALLALPAPAIADEPLPARFKATHELQAQGEGPSLTLAIRSTYSLAPEARQLGFAAPISWPIELISPAGATLIRDAAGQPTGATLPEGHRELVLSGSQRVQVASPTRLHVPLAGAGGLELLVVTGGDAAQWEPAEALGRHIGYWSSAQVTEEEGAAFSSWRAGQRLGQQYILIRTDQSTTSSLDGRLTTRDSRSRPVIIALIVAAVLLALVLFVLRKGLEDAAIEEEADAIIKQRFGDLRRRDP